MEKRDAFQCPLVVKKILYRTDGTALEMIVSDDTDIGNCVQ